MYLNNNIVCAYYSAIIIINRCELNNAPRVLPVAPTFPICEQRFTHQNQHYHFVVKRKFS